MTNSEGSIALVAMCSFVHLSSLLSSRSSRLTDISSRVAVLAHPLECFAHWLGHDFDQVVSPFSIICTVWKMLVSFDSSTFWDDEIMKEQKHCLAAEAMHWRECFEMRNGLHWKSNTMLNAKIGKGNTIFTGPIIHIRSLACSCVKNPRKIVWIRRGTVVEVNGGG